jgi:hypothetical protein
MRHFSQGCKHDTKNVIKQTTPKIEFSWGLVCGKILNYSLGNCNQFSTKNKQGRFHMVVGKIQQNIIKQTPPKNKILVGVNSIPFLLK